MPDVTRAAAAQERAFGVAFGVDDFVRRLEKHQGFIEIWVAEAQGEVVCTGRLEVVLGTEFAGVWGGGTVPEWRGRGIYRALTAARANRRCVGACAFCTAILPSSRGPSCSAAACRP
jgi:ribosomal protein S18 acetylase RimI-like enzyme